MIERKADESKGLYRGPAILVVGGKEIEVRAVEAGNGDYFVTSSNVDLIVTPEEVAGTDPEQGECVDRILHDLVCRVPDERGCVMTRDEARRRIGKILHRG